MRKVVLMRQASLASTVGNFGFDVRIDESPYMITVSRTAEPLPESEIDVRRVADTPINDGDTVWRARRR